MGAADLIIPEAPHTPGAGEAPTLGSLCERLSRVERTVRSNRTVTLALVVIHVPGLLALVGKIDADTVKKLAPLVQVILPWSW